MERFILKHKDRDILVFTIEGLEVTEAIIDRTSIKYLPLPIKRVIHNADEFIKQVDETDIVLNEDGAFLVDNWLSDREIPINRDNYRAYIKRNSTARQWMLENNSLSFTDCYWTMKENDNLLWADICKKLDSVDNFINIQDENRHYKGTNATLGGQLEKFWYRDGNNLKLCKKNEPLSDILSARELMASFIYERQGLREDKDFCKYEFISDSSGYPVGISCNAFTNRDKELITAYDLLEEYNLTQQDEVYELIPILAKKYGLDEKETYDYLDMQTMVDFLIMNRDRHQGNIAFLRDSDTLQIVSVAPIFDSGSCRMLEADTTENDLLGTKVNGLYNTDGECLNHIMNPSILDISKLPSRDELKQIMDKCINIAELRKTKLLNLYEKKISYLFDLQRSTARKPEQIDRKILDKFKNIIDNDILLEKLI